MGFGLAAALPELVALSIGRRQPCLGARDQPRLEVVETCDTLPVCRISRPASDPSPQRICLDDVFLVNLGQVCTIVHGPLPSCGLVSCARSLAIQAALNFLGGEDRLGFEVEKSWFGLPGD